MRASLSLLITALGLTAAGAVSTASAQAKVIIVRPGQSIQAAINHAGLGDTIAVRRGFYRENLVVTRGPLTIVGPATLLQPRHPTFSPCVYLEGETPVGICVYGRAAHDVKIERLTIRGFAGSGVLAGFVRRLAVVRSVLVGNHGYGASAFHAQGVTFRYNRAERNTDAAYYIGRSPAARAVLVGNRARANIAPGILVRSASQVLIANNRIAENCAGILVLADAPGPAAHANIVDNQIRRNNRRCAPDREGYMPSVSGLGIGLIGAAYAQVLDNQVVNNKPSGQSSWTGGVILRAGRHGTPATHDAVRHNRLRGNRAADLTWDGRGENELTPNDCHIARPGGLC